MVKLKPHEAHKLAELLIRVARPRTPEEAAEVDRWVQQLARAR
jgi:hypothetical protein